MIPSRGLPRRQLGSLASCQPSALRSGTSRKFSSIPRRTASSALPCRTSALRSTTWRAGATATSSAALPATAVRYGSWYAPWSWGKSTPPANAPTAEIASEPVPVPQPAVEPAVTTATPEIQPASIDQSAASTVVPPSAGKTSVEDLLAEELREPAASFVDPAVPISYWGNLKDLGLDYGWGPSAMFESLLEMLYINTELGWAGTIVASALILRTGLFFTFQRMSSDANAKMVAAKPLLQPLQDQMEEAKRQGDEERSQMLKLKQQGIMKTMGVDIWKQLGGGAAQAVFGYGAWRSLRGLSTLPAPGMSADGWLWFHDLTVADPYYLLPAMTGGVLFLLMKRGGETGLQDQTAQTSLQKGATYVFPTLMCVITSWQPAGVQLYFFVTGLTGAITATLLRNNSVRKMLRMRLTPSAKSQELYSKVISGEIELAKVKSANGRVRYQAPTAPRSRTLASGLNLKSGAKLPPHMVAAVQEEAAPEKPKGAWEQLKNIRSVPRTLGEKVQKWQDPRDPEVKKKQDARERQKRELLRYNEEKKRALGGK